jgi:N-acyl-D-aspartate/D-glutamate deacylase
MTGLLLQGGTRLRRPRQPGVLLEGAVADLCVLDPATVGHEGTYLDPDVPVTGIRQVVLGGDLVVEDGRFTGLRAGKVLRRGGSSPPGAG